MGIPASDARACEIAAIVTSASTEFVAPVNASQVAHHEPRLGFVLIRAAVMSNRRYLVGVPFLFQWVGFCLLCWAFVVLVWALTSLWTWLIIDPMTAMMQYAVVIVLYPLLAPLLARVRPRDPLNVPEPSRGTARPGETTI